MIDPSGGGRARRSPPVAPTAGVAGSARARAGSRTRSRNVASSPAAKRPGARSHHVGRPEDRRLAVVGEPTPNSGSSTSRGSARGSRTCSALPVGSVVARSPCGVLEPRLLRSSRAAVAVSGPAVTSSLVRCGRPPPVGRSSARGSGWRRARDRRARPSRPRSSSIARSQKRCTAPMSWVTSSTVAALRADARELVEALLLEARRRRPRAPRRSAGCRRRPGSSR